MATTYYLCQYCLDGQIAYLIWYSNDSDGIVTLPDGKVPSFSTTASLLQYTEAHGLTIKTEPLHPHNLDQIVAWLKNESTTVIDCNEFLAAWNLFSDVSASVGGDFDQDLNATENTYDKLFWGCNLPAVTPSGEKYTPNWTDDELYLVRVTLVRGLNLFRASIKPVEQII